MQKRFLTKIGASPGNDSRPLEGFWQSLVRYYLATEKGSEFCQLLGLVGDYQPGDFKASTGGGGSFSSNADAIIVTDRELAFLEIKRPGNNSLEKSQHLMYVHQFFRNIEKMQKAGSDFFDWYTADIEKVFCFLGDQFNKPSLSASYSTHPDRKEGYTVSFYEEEILTESSSIFHYRIEEVPVSKRDLLAPWIEQEFRVKYNFAPISSLLNFQQLQDIDLSWFLKNLKN